MEFYFYLVYLGVMEKNRKKTLWKIEELWEKFPQSPASVLNYNKGIILNNYQNKRSKYFSEFTVEDEFNFSLSDFIVHSDNYGEYKGLKSSQLFFSSDKPIYLFDNHNKIIYPIVELFQSKKQALNIVHIDAHPDDAKFNGLKASSLNLQDSQSYIAKTRISDFFDALSETNIIDTIYPVTHSDSFEFFLPPEKSYILSLDIDIFGPEGDFCELKDKVKAIALAWSKAEAVCIATSPGFINQEYARDIINIFLSSK